MRLTQISRSRLYPSHYLMRYPGSYQLNTLNVDVNNLVQILSLQGSSTFSYHLSFAQLLSPLKAPPTLVTTQASSITSQGFSISSQHSRLLHLLSPLKAPPTPVTTRLLHHLSRLLYLLSLLKAPPPPLTTQGSSSSSHHSTLAHLL